MSLTANSERGAPAELNLGDDVVALATQICNIPSASGEETCLADAVEHALSALPHLDVMRDGDAVVARTRANLDERVILAGHLDTVPVAGNLPVRREMRDGRSHLVGRGTVDMKAGVAVFLSLAAELVEPSRDITYVLYDHEEVEDNKNGLGRLVRHHPEWLAAHFAVLGEPTNGEVEGGCNGTIRADVLATGKAAHSARAWMGRNAVHRAGEILGRLNAYEPATIDVDGLAYREGLNAVLISGGTATNVIPDVCRIMVNYRFAPKWTIEQAIAHVCEVFEGFDVTVVDAAPAARPGLDSPLAADFLAATGAVARPKYGWTDVARFSELGVPAINFGPGDPSDAHTDDEGCPEEQIRQVREALRAWLTT